MSDDMALYDGMYIMTFLAKEPALPGGPRGFRFSTVRGKEEKTERKIEKFAKKHVRRQLREVGIEDYLVAERFMRESSIIFHATEDQRVALSAVESDVIKIANLRELMTRKNNEKAVIRAELFADRERREFETARDTYMRLREKYEAE